MKVYDKNVPLEGPIDHSWLQNDPLQDSKPHENFSLIKLMQSPEFKVKPQPVAIAEGKPVVDDIEAKQQALKAELLWGILRGQSDAEILQNLPMTFAPEFIKGQTEVIDKVLGERGLFGSVYVTAKMLPNCVKGEGRDLIQASSARYMVAKQKCGDCQYNNGSCLQYGKQLVEKIPYDRNTLLAYRAQLMREHAADPFVLVKAGKTVKQALRDSFLSTKQTSVPRVAETVKTVQQQSRELNIGDKTPDYMATYKVVAKQILKGSVEESFTNSMPYRDLIAESGLYGPLYVKLNAFDSCGEAKEFLDKVGNKALYVVSDKPCHHYDSNTGKCAVLDRVLVRELDYTDQDVVRAALKHNLSRGAINTRQAREIVRQLQGKNAGMARNVIAKMNKLVPTKQTAIKSYAKMATNKISIVTPDAGSAEEVIRYVKARMNEGYYGADLQQLIRLHFDASSITKAASTLKPILAEQGLQGIYYLDPTPYSSCDEGAGYLRTKGIKYVMAMKACKGCTANSEGFCMKYGKAVVDEVPYLNREAQQREILNRTSSTPLEAVDVFSYASMLDQMQLSTSCLEGIDINKEAAKQNELEYIPGGMVLDFED